jgi:hypothetical protein
MSFSYVLTTDLGKVRLLIADTNAQTRVFEDEELQVFLDLNGSDLNRAAGQAYETWAADRSKIAKSIGTGQYKTERQAVESLLAMADRIRSAGTVGTVQTGKIASSDQEYLDEYRPDWRDVDTDVTVVE